LSASPAAYATTESPYIIYQGHANSAVSPHNSTARFSDVIFGSNGYDLYVSQNGTGIEKLDTRSLVPGESTTATFSNFDLSSEIATQSAGFAVSSDGQYAYVSGGNSACAIIKFNLVVPSNSCIYPGTSFENIEISPNDGFVYAAGENRVLRVNTTTNETSTITVPGLFGLSSAISGSHLYLYNLFTGHMFEINTETFELSGDYTISSGFTVGESPGHLSIVGNNIYLSSLSSSQGYVVKYDVTTHLTSRIDVRMGALSTIDLFGLQVSSDGNYGWFIDIGNLKVRQISLTGSDAGTIRSSIAMPATSVTAVGLSINSTGSLVAYSSRKNDTQWLTVISAGQFVVSAIDPIATPTSAPAIDPAIAIKAAAEARARAVEVAKTEIKSVLSSGKPLTADQLLSADFNGATSKNIGLVNSDIAKLSDSDKTDLKQIEKVVLKFATVDKLAEGKTVYSSDLIAVGLIPQDSKIKSSITSALKKLPASSLDTFEKIQAEIASVEKKHADRKARLAAILDKQKR
jgi:hypothetical protein